MNFRKTFYLSFLILIIICSQDPLSAKEFKGAELRTDSAYTYGRFEVSMKSAHREGMLSSFFTYFTGTSEDPWMTSKWNEIDLEIMGRYDDNVQFNTITPGQVNHVGHLPVKFSPHLDFHVYAFEWTPDYVAWFVDGLEVLRQTGAHIQTLTRPQKIMMNVWNPRFENWAGVLNPATLPAFAYYDWVSYYEYTPGEGNYGSDNNFTHQWTDNFDSWDTERWSKGTHTWDGNGTDFIEENAVFRDGKLILCLTNSINTGYTDVTAPTVLWARANSNDKITVRFSEEVNQSDAETLSRYYITTTGITITEASLKPDLKSVELTVSGIDLNSSYLLIVYPVRDRAPVPNTSVTQAKSVLLYQPLSFPVKINCGGPAALDYLPEVNWNFSSEYGSMDGTSIVHSSTLEINGTDEDEIFQSERYNIAGYKIRLPNGRYDVKLMFSEHFGQSSGTRIFDVYLEHNLVEADLDVFDLAGKDNALIKEFIGIDVNDEIMDIHFAESANSGFINGIIITQNPTGIKDTETGQLESFNIEQNYPNPFNPSTRISWQSPVGSWQTIKVFDLLGNEIVTLVDEYREAGRYEVEFNPASSIRHPASGIYFYQLLAGDFTLTKKMVLMR